MGANSAGLGYFSFLSPNCRYPDVDPSPLPVLPPFHPLYIPRIDLYIHSPVVASCALPLYTELFLLIPSCPLIVPRFDAERACEKSRPAILTAETKDIPGSFHYACPYALLVH